MNFWPVFLCKSYPALPTIASYGRDEIRVPLKTPTWEATPTRAQLLSHDYLLRILKTIATTLGYKCGTITEFCKLYLCPAGCNNDSNLLSIFRFSCIRYCINSPFGAIVLLLNHYFSTFIYLNTFLQIEGSERDKRILKVVFLWLFTSNVTNCTNPKKKCQKSFL